MQISMDTQVSGGGGGGSLEETRRQITAVLRSPQWGGLTPPT